MPQNPEATFDRFLDLAQQKLRGVSSTTARGGLWLVQGAPATLGERVAALEATEEFRALCAGVEGLLQGNGFGTFQWSRSLGNWFRRSRLYHNLATGEALPDSKTLFERLCQELSRRESEVTYFALVEHVYFGAEQLDFGRYEIARFAKEELDRLLETEVRATFYPSATVPTDVLSQYWWIVIREKNVPTMPIPIPHADRISVNLTEIDTVSRSYTALPYPVERALQELALFDWRLEWAGDERRWAPFGIPILVKADDHLTTSPRGARIDVSILDTEPYDDPVLDEEIGERPAIWFYFDEAEAEALRGFVAREGDHLDRALAIGWSRPLLEVASRFFAKAFVSEGLEQLLWHITTIEALVGARDEAVMETLARRLSEALGGSESERKQIARTFKALYDFRSALVHGREPQKTVLTRHLVEARELARGLLRWFIRFIWDVQNHIEAGGGDVESPKRKDVLRLLDLEGEGLRRTRRLLPVLSDSFPRYPDLSR